MSSSAQQSSVKYQANAHSAGLENPAYRFLDPIMTTAENILHGIYKDYDVQSEDCCQVFDLFTDFYNNISISFLHK